MFTSQHDSFLYMQSSSGRFAVCVDDWSALYNENKEPCELTSVGSFDKQMLAMAVPKGHPVKTRIDLALLELKKSGEFETIRQKWFPTDCTSASDTHRATLVTFITTAFILVLSMPLLY